MLTTEDKNSPVPSGSFVVTISQNLGGENTDTATLLRHFPQAITAFSFSQNSFEEDGEPYFFDMIDEDDDDDGYEMRDAPEESEDEDEEEPSFTLTLDYNLTYNVIRELRDCLPIPDDTDLVVTIGYHTADNQLLFYHEFRGSPMVPPDVAGNLSDPAPLSGKFELDCESFSLFVLG
jgi:hypothetical protein